jgi:DNA-binding HxlR family transcriptional regulator
MKKYPCPVFQAADIVGKKWAIVLLQEINLHGDKGFVFIQKRMKKISPKILTQRIQELGELGVIKKQVKEEQKRKGVSYSLTKKGEDFYKIILALRDWKTQYANDDENCAEKHCVNCELF